MKYLFLIFAILFFIYAYYRYKKHVYDRKKYEINDTDRRGMKK